ncbi:MAG: hypothetical protein KAI83_09655, partial [Thiomargarita sp.]|nr:hypothetical protein [Thiomargarita sp.]
PNLKVWTPPNLKVWTPPNLKVWTPKGAHSHFQSGRVGNVVAHQNVQRFKDIYYTPWWAKKKRLPTLPG